MIVPTAFLGPFGDAIDFIFTPGDPLRRRHKVGGLDQVWECIATQLEISAFALAIALAIALPARRSCSATTARASWLAVALGNAWRAIPELALIAIVAAFIGFGFAQRRRWR